MIKILTGDCRSALKQFPGDYFHICITSPPYYSLRDYGADTAAVWPSDLPPCADHDWGADGFCAQCGAWLGQLGHEPTVELYVAHLVEVFMEVHRVLRDDGVLFLNIGDSYFSGAHHGQLKPKDLCGIPWRVALALQAEGWCLRSDIIWEKPSIKPESVKDRPVKAHEYVFLLAKRPHYYFDWVAIQEPIKESSIAKFKAGQGVVKYASVPGQGTQWIHQPRAKDPRRPVAAMRNKRTVWRVAGGFRGAHYAVFPPALIEPMVKAGSSQAGCCAACGAPLRRVLERRTSSFYAGEVKAGRGDKKDTMQYRATEKELEETYALDTVYWYHTIGWKPTCSCEAGRVSCRVLDPFGGSGTTALVAEKLGRDSVLIEIKPDFVKLARKRLETELGGMTIIEVIE